MTLPSFVHDFDKWWSMNWEYGEVHSKPGTFHLVIDFFLNNAQRKIDRHKNKPYYRVFRAFLNLAWGLNCGFPTKDVINFTVWEFRGLQSN